MAQQDSMYVLLDDCSGTRATVIGVYDSEGAAHAARMRGGAGMSRVGSVAAELGTPVMGERVWFSPGALPRGETAVVTGRGVNMRGSARDALAQLVVAEAAKRHILEHAVGFSSRSPFYRNHYCAGPDADSWPLLLELCAEGLMRDIGAEDDIGGMRTFCVTDKGKARLR